MSVFSFYGVNPSTAAGVFSPCGSYRYRLDRDMTQPPRNEDQTTMKWRGFTVRNAGSRYIVGNPFALCSTDVRALAAAADPVGPDNDLYLDQIIAESDILVPCWGNTSKVPPRLRHHFGRLLDKLSASGKPIRIFGLTKSGDPKHPLMLGYDTQLIEWSRP